MRAIQGGKVLLGTTNPGKLDKLHWLFDVSGLELATPRDLMPMPTASEDGATHLDIAEHKAKEWSRWSGLPTVATDGGLVLPVLGERWESRYTARFAGAGESDRTRLDRLLEIMKPYGDDSRTAYWLEALALAQDNKILKSWTVESRPGLLADTYDPTAMIPGFWAFSLWHIPEFGKTYNLLTPQELARADDHWSRLKVMVGLYLKANPPVRGD